MNYLKEMKTALKVYESEQEYTDKKLAACKLIEKIAKAMYDAELDRTQYCVWSAIIDLLDAVKYRY